MKRYWALAQMPLPRNEDAVLYDERDGRECDGRELVFAQHCLDALRELGELSRIRSWKRVLDVGSGRGALVAMLNKEGSSSYWCIDPQPIKEPLWPVMQCSLSGMREGGLFDYVMAWHVLEHTMDPVKFIRDMMKVVAPGGRIIIATPNADSLMARKNWRCKEIFHTYLIGQKLLSEIIEDNGFQIIKKMTWGGFPAPRKWWQNVANKILKWIGNGDVQLVIAGRKG